MTPQEAFKIGFLARCIEENFSQEKIAEASEAFSKLGGSEFLDSITDIGKLGMGAAIAAPPAAGILASYFANKASDPTTMDVDLLRKQELVDEYRRASQQLEQQHALRKYKQQRQNTKSIYL